ncbi:MAG: M55 family metallopeptidase [Lentisphaeria bacterium]|nr:M55 family metallopeptidase [Lentisphaeria bacterium]
MKVMILTDLEGPSGVNGRSDGIGNTIVNCPAAEAALVQEVNACCEGLVAAGADEIVVLDGHGGSNNIDIFQLHPAASLMQLGGQQPVCWIDSSYDAFVMIGAHCMHSTLGHMSHSYNSHGTARLTLNGREIGEIGLGARIGAYFGVPLILVSGDQAACREAEQEIGPEVVTVQVKEAWSRYTAINYSPEKVHRLLRDGAEAALKKLPEIPCLPMEKHYGMTKHFMCPNQAFPLEMTGGKRLDECTVQFESDDLIDLVAQSYGWAAGVHNRKYGISPEWVFRG